MNQTIFGLATNTDAAFISHLVSFGNKGDMISNSVVDRISSASTVNLMEYVKLAWCAVPKSFCKYHKVESNMNKKSQVHWRTCLKEEYQGLILYFTPEEIKFLEKTKLRSKFP